MERLIKWLCRRVELNEPFWLNGWRGLKWGAFLAVAIGYLYNWSEFATVAVLLVAIGTIVLYIWFHVEEWY